jgi:hypothetical protein
MSLVKISYPGIFIMFPLQANVTTVFETGNYHFLSHPFPLIIQHHCIIQQSMLYNL